MGLAKSIRLYGNLKRASAFAHHNTIPHSFVPASFLGHNLAAFDRFASPPAHATKSAANFSTRPFGLRHVSWTRPAWSPDLCSVGPHYDERSFRYADAHGCVFHLRRMLANPGLKRSIGLVHEETKVIENESPDVAIARVGKDAAIVQEELEKVVRPAGRTQSWPILMTGHTEDCRQIFLSPEIPTITWPHEFAKRPSDAVLGSSFLARSFEGKRDLKVLLEYRVKSGRHRSANRTTYMLSTRSYATIASDRVKERSISWRGVTEEQEKEAARAEFHESNPFNDPLAHNCVVIIPNVPFVVKDGEYKVVQTHELFEPQAAIIRAEVSKLLVKAGKTPCWPTIWELEDNDLLFYFKVPHGEDLQAFESRLSQAGLVGGRFEELGREWDEWWYSTLHFLVKKGNKLW